MKAYEIQTYTNGRWKIDSVFDDRQLAVFEAKRMDQSGKYSGVRVTLESVNETSGKIVSQTVFRGGKVTKANAKQLQKRSTANQKVDLARKKQLVENAERKRQVKRQAVKKKSSPVRLIVILILLGGFAAGAMIGLSKLDKML